MNIRNGDVLAGRFSVSNVGVFLLGSATNKWRRSIMLSPSLKTAIRKMNKELKQVLDNDKVGWENSEFRSLWIDRLLDNLEREDYIDVIAYAMFLWSMRDESLHR